MHAHQELWLIIGIAPRRMIGGVQDLADFRYLLANRFFNPHFERHIRGSAALAAAAEPKIDRVLPYIDKLHPSTVHPQGWIDLSFKKILYLLADLGFGRHDAVVLRTNRRIV